MARLPYREAHDLPEGSRDLVESSLQPGKTVNVYRAMANNPAVLAGLRAFLGALWTESGLSDREREVVILAVARHHDSAYEWHQHVAVARSVGLSDAEIRAVSRGDLDRVTDREATLVRYALAVVDGTVDDATHDRAAAACDDSTLVGAAAIAAGYAALAGVIDAFAVDLEEPFVGWLPGES